MTATVMKVCSKGHNWWRNIRIRLRRRSQSLIISMETDRRVKIKKSTPSSVTCVAFFHYNCVQQELLPKDRTIKIYYPEVCAKQFDKKSPNCGITGHGYSIAIMRQLTLHCLFICFLFFFYLFIYLHMKVN